jgi:hypothetical protein
MRFEKEKPLVLSVLLDLIRGFQNEAKTYRPIKLISSSFVLGDIAFSLFFYSYVNKGFVVVKKVPLNVIRIEFYFEKRKSSSFQNVVIGYPKTIAVHTRKKERVRKKNNTEPGKNFENVSAHLDCSLVRRNLVVKTEKLQYY